MLPLRRGMISIDTIELVDVDTQQTYSLRKPCLISVLAADELVAASAVRAAATAATRATGRNRRSANDTSGGSTTNSTAGGATGREEEAEKQLPRDEARKNRGSGGISGTNSSETMTEEVVQHILARRKSRSSFSE